MRWYGSSECNSGWIVGRTPPYMKTMRERRDTRPTASGGKADLSVVTSPTHGTNGQFERALRSARLYVFSQDRQLEVTRIYGPHGEQMPLAPDSEEVLAIKRRVLENGRSEEAEALYQMPEGCVLFSLRIDPTYGQDGNVDGIVCAAIEVGRMRVLESEHQQRTEALDTTVERYKTALRGSNVTVFTQDAELRYISISNRFLGRDVSEIAGRTDEEVIPPEGRSAVAALKAAALESGLPRDGEVRLNDGSNMRWYDLHVEPLHDATGRVSGLTGTAVDVTERKEGEAHLRLLMRELTHRSKNLLAVIQAMARQTARHVGTIDGFLEQFSARLQALARSHDLLVQEEWHGVSLAELVRSQLAPYLDRSGSQIVMDGPAVVLRPEAAQSLGLALHELAVNAVRFGALSIPAGRVSITWIWQPQHEPPAVEILWVESNGPPVTAPMQRGFGTLVVERNLARALEAEVELTFRPEGVRSRITIPIAQLSRPTAAGA
jgi:PAS domain S-box-containing protein